MKSKLKIINTYCGASAIACFVAFTALLFLLFGFVGGVWVSDDHQTVSNQLVLPEHSTDEVVVYHRVHIYDGDSEDWTYTDFNKEVECLAKNIYFEAGNQDIQGQIAVGMVTINRVKSSKHPNSICEVVWRKLKNKRGKYVAHFSWTLDGKPDVPPELDVYENTIILAKAMIAERSLNNFVDNTNGSTHYHAHYVTPWWSSKLSHTLVVGDHLFYSSTPVALSQ